MSLLNDQFEGYYAGVYGSRWKELRESLLGKNDPVPYGSGLVKPYMLDRSSALAAQSLDISAAGPILDACAAPGGKSLVIASRMGPQAALLANELSGERRRRLAKVLDEHLPPELRERVRVAGFDAAAAGGKKSELGRFAAILLDAPCSSERHVLGSEKALAEWTPARPRFLAKRQWALLSSAFLLLQDGGSLVYATCALSPEENDAVVSRLVEKYGGAALVEKPPFAEGEATQHGRLILPDRAGGMGPMYVARIRKAALETGGEEFLTAKPNRGRPFHGQSERISKRKNLSHSRQGIKNIAVFSDIYIDVPKLVVPVVVHLKRYRSV